jgi:hypothetical protein
LELTFTVSGSLPHPDVAGAGKARVMDTIPKHSAAIHIIHLLSCDFAFILFLKLIVDVARRLPAGHVPLYPGAYDIFRLTYNATL